MKESDYYGHYKAFVKELNSKPGQTLQIYCRENGVVWRRLYDWMRRHHISLKKLYQTYRSEPKTAVRLTDNADNIEFRELIQGRVNAGQSCLCGDVNVIKGVCLKLPSGITVSLEDCGVEVLSRLIAGLAGREVADVLS